MKGEKNRDLSPSCDSSVSLRPPVPAPHPPRRWCRRYTAGYRSAAGDSSRLDRISSAGRTPCRAGSSRRREPVCSHRAGTGDTSCPAGRDRGSLHIGWRLHTGTSPSCTGGRSQKLGTGRGGQSDGGDSKGRRRVGETVTGGWDVRTGFLMPAVASDCRLVIWSNCTV